MSRHVGEIATLVDTEQRQIGQMQIERQEDDLLYGTFAPGPAFSSVQPLFRDFEEAVEAQALSLVETLDEKIATLGLTLKWPGAEESIAIQDVQIWRDGSTTCRICEQTAQVSTVRCQAVTGGRDETW